MATEPEETQTVEGKADWSLRVGRPPLDITMFRTEKGGDPEIVRESQRRRNPVEDDPDGEQKKAQDAAGKLVDDPNKLGRIESTCLTPGESVGEAPSTRATDAPPPRSGEAASKSERVHEGDSGDRDASAMSVPPPPRSLAETLEELRGASLELFQGG